jgi:hypothetical protein
MGRFGSSLTSPVLNATGGSLSRRRFEVSLAAARPNASYGGGLSGSATAVRVSGSSQDLTRRAAGERVFSKAKNVQSLRRVLPVGTPA